MIPVRVVYEAQLLLAPGTGVPYVLMNPQTVLQWENGPHQAAFLAQPQPLPQSGHPEPARGVQYGPSVPPWLQRNNGQPQQSMAVRPARPCPPEVTLGQNVNWHNQNHRLQQHRMANMTLPLRQYDSTSDALNDSANRQTSNLQHLERFSTEVSTRNASSQVSNISNKRLLKNKKAINANGPQNKHSFGVSQNSSGNNGTQQTSWRPLSQAVNRTSGGSFTIRETNEDSNAGQTNGSLVYSSNSLSVFASREPESKPVNNKTGNEPANHFTAPNVIKSQQTQYLNQVVEMMRPIEIVRLRNEIGNHSSNITSGNAVFVSAHDVSNSSLHRPLCSPPWISKSIKQEATGSEESFSSEAQDKTLNIIETCKRPKIEPLGENVKTTETEIMNIILVETKNHLTSENKFKSNGIEPTVEVDETHIAENICKEKMEESCKYNNKSPYALQIIENVSSTYSEKTITKEVENNDSQKDKTTRLSVKSDEGLLTKDILKAAHEKVSDDKNDLKLVKVAIKTEDNVVVNDRKRAVCEEVKELNLGVRVSVKRKSIEIEEFTTPKVIKVSDELHKHLGNECNPLLITNNNIILNHVVDGIVIQESSVPFAIKKRASDKTSHDSKQCEKEVKSNQFVPNVELTKVLRGTTLTHVIDGILIQESDRPFPIRIPGVKVIKKLRRKKPKMRFTFLKQTKARNLKNEIHKKAKRKGSVEVLKISEKKKERIKEDIKSPEAELQISKCKKSLQDKTVITTDQEINDEKLESLSKDLPNLNDDETMEDEEIIIPVVDVETLESWSCAELQRHLRRSWCACMAALAENEVDGRALLLARPDHLAAVGVCARHARALCRLARGPNY